MENGERKGKGKGKRKGKKSAHYPVPWYHRSGEIRSIMDSFGIRFTEGVSETVR